MHHDQPLGVDGQRGEAVLRQSGQPGTGLVEVAGVGGQPGPGGLGVRSVEHVGIGGGDHFEVGFGAAARLLQEAELEHEGQHRGVGAAGPDADLSDRFEQRLHLVGATGEQRQHPSPQRHVPLVEGYAHGPGRAP